MWWLVLFMNGYAVDYGSFKTNAQCTSHQKTVMAAFKQAESQAVVRCEWRDIK